MSDVVVEPSGVAEICVDGQALLSQHALELEPEWAEALDPDWDAYYQAEQEGRLIAFVVKAGDKIVGYAAGFVFNALHYRGRVDFQGDVFYVDPIARRQRIGLRLLNKLRMEAAMRGVHWFRMHAKPGSPMERLLRTLGFNHDESLFTEDLQAWAQRVQSEGS